VSDFRHRYKVTECPECGANLLLPNSVDVEFVATGSMPWVTPSRLGAGAELVDTDGNIAKGLHSDTRCSACGESLSDHEVLE
jgi:hypothetical protein